MKPIVIIGTGLAGYTLAREFRKLERARPLFILTADNGGFYSKPMLSNAFAQRKHVEQLVTQTAAQMAAQLSATIVTGTRVVSIDTSAKTVATDAGTFEYGTLVLAVGAQAVRLPLEGDAANDVLSVNHVSDYAHFRRALEQSGPNARVTILGAGLIGCEFADDLSGHGHDVTLVDPNPLPLSSLAAPALSRGLQAALEARRVKLQLGTTAKRVGRNGKSLTVTLANNIELQTDVVLSAVGLRPDLRLAQASGLDTARGVLVDEYGRTSMPDVYALGDCAEYGKTARGGVLPYIAPLMAAARAIARTLAGQPTEIDFNQPAPVIVKTPSFPLALIPAPAARAAGFWQENQHGERIVCRYYDGNGVMQGFGVTPHDANVRQRLLAELGTTRLNVA